MANKKNKRRTRVSYLEKETIREAFDKQMTLAEREVIDNLVKDSGRSLSTIRRAVYRTLG